jgi:hypothetical protein
MSLGVALLLTACDPVPAKVGEMQVRDSMGVQIVEHRGFPSGLPLWSVDRNLNLSVGAVDGIGPAVFGRVTTVTETASGMIVVADAAASELRAFDSSGVHLWTAGRRGDGPGEFRSLTAIATLAEDSIVVYDYAMRRLSVFTRSGEFARGHRIDVPSELSAPRLAGVTRGGALIGLAQGASRMEPGRYQTVVRALFYSPMGSMVAEGPGWSGGDFVMVLSDGGAAYWSAALPMGRQTRLAVGPTDAVVATQERFEVLRFDGNGQLHQVVRIAVAPTLVDVARHEAAGLSRINGILADTLPALHRILLDAADHLWVEEYVPQYEDRQPVWWILTSEGRFLARASLPRGFTPGHAGEDHVVGVSQDSLGVQYIQRWRIARRP